MKNYNKRKFVTAIIATVVSAVCLIAYFAAGREDRFIFGFFLALIYAGMEYYGTLSKETTYDELQQCTDERDIFIAMKTSQTTLRLLNRLLLSGCVISALLHAIFRWPACFTVFLTLCISCMVLFAVLLLTNFYYEKHS